eukprot:7132276-Heterocapsa_arctica.AAC.1
MDEDIVLTMCASLQDQDRLDTYMDVCNMFIQGVRRHILTRQEEERHVETVEAAKKKEVSNVLTNGVYQEVTASRADGARKLQMLR